MFQVYRLRAFRNEIRVEEGEMGALILGVIMDVLVHVFVQLRQCFVVSGISAPVRLLAVLDPGQLVVLDPEIGFQDFGGSCEPEQSCIARCKPFIMFL